MNIRLLRLVGEELRLLRAEGVEAIPVSEDTLARLKRAGGEGGDPEAVAAAPTERGDAAKGEAARAAPTRPEAPSRTGEASAPAKGPEFPPPPEIDLGEGGKPEKWERLRERVLACPVCLENRNPGKRIVFGVGSLDAEIFFCGEAPGADEEAEGEPFVGRAGELLNGMIRAMGLRREDVYIGNIMNWRPRTGSSYGNRPPTDEEMAFCLPYLKAQIAVVRPKVIVALGGTATKGLLGVETRGQMGKLRGRWHEFEETPLMVTYHPSYLLHQESLASKRKVWEDLLRVMERLEMPISERQRNFFLAALKRE